VSGFLSRVGALPVLGVGVSTEYGAAAAPGALDIAGLRAVAPHNAAFLEVGVEVAKGLDADARAWAASGRPATYHFLDLNLDEPEDQDAAWLDGVRALAGALGAAWICGDAGLWHMGPRDRAHMMLLPPILEPDAAAAMGAGVQALRAATGLEVLPENPPGAVFVGRMHLLDWFARLCEAGDTGMLLDAAHLAIFQRSRGHAARTGLDGFPLERVVELHIAGGVERVGPGGFGYVEDTHAVDVLPETWEIVEAVVAGAPNLRAVVFECERNRVEETLPVFARIHALLRGHPLLGRGAA